MSDRESFNKRAAGRPGHNIPNEIQKICCASLIWDPQHSAGCLIHLQDRIRNDNRLAESIARVLKLCDEWDKLSKGEGPTTKSIRDAIYGSERA